MIEVRVKTLDGKNLTFNVDDNITVKEFKEKIVSDIEISAENQRLIYHGRVLHDDKKLNDYDVDGKTVHVVQRTSPSTSAQPGSSGGATGGASGVGDNTGETRVQLNGRPAGNVANPIMNAINQAFQRTIGDNGRPPQITTRQGPDGSGSVEIRFGQNVQARSAGQTRLNLVRSIVRRTNRVLHRIEAGPSRRRHQDSNMAATGRGEQQSGTGHAQSSGDAEHMETEQQSAEDSVEEEGEGAGEDLDEGEEHDLEGAETEVTAHVLAVVEEVTELHMTPEEAQQMVAAVDVQTEPMVMQVVSTDNGQTQTTFSWTGAPNLSEMGAQTSLSRDESSAQTLATVAMQEIQQQQNRTNSSAQTPASHTDSAAQTTTPRAQPNGQSGGPRADSGVQAGQSEIGAGSETSAEGTQTEAGAAAVQHPPTSALADLMTEVLQLNTRLQPHLERYQSLMREDPTLTTTEETRNQQRFFELTSESLHYLSHAYHCLSDLMVDFRQAPPRNVRAPRQLIQATMNVQHVPIATVTASMAVPASAGQTPASNTAASNPATTAASASVTSAATTAAAASSSAAATTQSAAAAGTTQSMQGLPPFMDANFMQNMMQMAASAIPGAAMGAMPGAVSFSMPGAMPGAVPAGMPGAVPFSMPGSMPGAMQGFAMGAMPGAPGQRPHGQGTTQAMPGLPPFMDANFMQNMMQMAASAIPGAAMGAMPGAVSFSMPGAMPGAVPAGMPGAVPFSMPDAMPGAMPGAMQGFAMGAMPGAPGQLPHGQVFVMTQPGGTPVRINLPMNTMAAGNTPRTSTSSAQPVSTGSSRQASSSQQSSSGQQTGSNQPGAPIMAGGNAGQRNALPGHHGHGHRHPRMDPFLPCRSRHFGHPMAPPRGLMMPPPQFTNQPRPGPRPAVNRANPGPRPSGPPNPFASLFNGDQASVGPSGAQTAGAAANFMQQLGNILQQVRNQTGNQSSTGSASSTPTRQSASSGACQSNTGSSQNVTNDFVASVVDGMTAAFQQASMGQSPGTIHQFMENMNAAHNITGDNEPEVVSRVFHLVTQHMSFVDLMQVCLGQPAPLQRLRAPLQTFIRAEILSGGEPTEENIERGVASFLNECSDWLESVTANVETQNDIDIESTLNTFLENNLTSLVTFIMYCPATSTTFGTELLSRIRRIVHEFVTLGDLCVGRDRFTQLVATRMNDMGAGASPAMLQMINQMAAQHLHTMREGITLTSSDVHQYVVKRSAHKMDTSSQKSEEDEHFMSADEGETSTSSQRAEPQPAKPATSKQAAKPKTSQEAAKPKTSQEAAKPATSQVAAKPATSQEAAKPATSPQPAATAPDEIELSPANRAVPFPMQTAAGAWLDCGPEYSAARVAPPPTQRALQASRCVQAPANQSAPAEVTRPDDWHAVVPSEWVSVISRDMETLQRDKGNQRPLSDAYIAGMPTKRRKVVHDSRPDTRAFTTPDEHLSTVVTETAGALGLQPITSREELERDLRENSTLHQAFHQQVRDDVRQRCRDDTDFMPGRHSNTEKYFGNKKS